MGCFCRSIACGPGFAKTELGDDLIDAGNASYGAIKTINEAEELIEDTFKNASIDAIDTMINSTDLNNSDVKLVGEIAKTAIKIS